MVSSQPLVVLVHGAFEDASVWRSVTVELERRGHRVRAVNLAGRGSDQTPARDVTLNTYRDGVLEAISAEVAPVILVGHSFGGITISTVAEAAPDKVRTLVYVAAFLPQDGDSQQSLAEHDGDSLLGAALEIDVARMVASVTSSRRADIFLNDGTPEQREGFAETMVDEPLQPPGTPVQLSAERFGAVPKAYIHTSQDRAVSPALQKLMVGAAGVTDIQVIDSGHCPFLTQPQQLAQAIDAIAGR